MFLTYYVHVCFRESSENAKSSLRPWGALATKECKEHPDTVEMAPVGYSHVADRLFRFVVIRVNL